jgi:two-component system heavy metal sensor histidine kinase CusS
MSSKNANQESADATPATSGPGELRSPVSPDPRPVKRPTWSITRRLTLHYIGSTATLLLVATGFLYLKLKQSLDARDRALLAGKVQVLRLLLDEHPDQIDVLANEIEHEAAESPLPYFLRVISGHERNVLETPGMNSVLPPSAFPDPIEVQFATPEAIKPHVRRHGPYLLLSVTTTAGGGGPRILQAGLDISQDLDLMNQYLRMLLGILVLGVLFAAVAGTWLTHKGVQPLAEISRTARQTSARQLHERLDASHWPGELAELAAAFNAMLDRLEQSFTRLAEFSSDLAHELRTPINNLRGEAEVSLARSRTPEEYQHLLASSLEEFERLSRMIDGMLFIARADNPDTAIEHVPFDARRELEAVCEFFEALAGEQDVSLELTGQATITGDSLLFRRAVSNLLSNALKHTPARGSIRLSLQSPDDQLVELTVCDSGEGIGPEVLPKVFQRFSRGDRSQSGASGGSGLGLAIVQSIMHLHHGTATIQSDPGTGTTATLRFPASP